MRGHDRPRSLISHIVPFPRRGRVHKGLISRGGYAFVAVWPVFWRRERDRGFVIGWGKLDNSRIVFVDREI